jgi:hypothetical protein
MIRCMICGQPRLCFWCKTTNGTTVVACIPCAIAGVELRIVEEVLLEKEVRDEQRGLEGRSEGEGLP